jgi:phosphatidylglycerol:prolipoprotein diacylglycerol transferase
MQQVLFRIPFPFFGLDGIPVFGFGVMLCLAFLVCTWLACRRGRAVGIAPQTIQDLVICLFIGGLLGARITFLVVEQPWPGGFWNTFKEQPGTVSWSILKQLPQIWQGGIVFYGSVLGGLAGYLVAWWFLLRKQKIPTLRLADVLAPSVAVGLCLGRMGCLLNGCCYGQVACANCAVYPTVEFPLSSPAREGLVAAGIQTAAGFTYAENQPGGRTGVRVGKVTPGSPAWNSGLRPDDIIVAAGDQAVHTPEELSAYLVNPRNWQDKSDLGLTVKHPGAAAPAPLPPFRPRTLPLYPTQVYESVSMALLLLVLLAYEPLRRREGQLMAVLMMGYAVHRYLDELLRDDPRPVGFERYTSVVLLAAGLAMWLWLQLRPAAGKEVPAAVASAPAPA